MALKIDASSLLAKQYLKVESDGIKYVQASLGGSTRRFRYHEIACILLSESNVLSFQVGEEVFSIQTRPDKTKHLEVISTFVHEVRRAHGQA